MTEVKNPRRVLAVSSEKDHQLLGRIVKELTGTTPEPSTSTSSGPSLAGTTHILPLKTSYYATDLPIWLDLISDPADWSASFLSEEAKEVLEVLGGVAVVFPLPAAKGSSPSNHDDVDDSGSASRALLSEVGKLVRDGLGGWEWDGVSLAVGVGDVPSEETEEWEDICAGCGLEFVHVRGGDKDEGRNEFGEKMGVPRVLEALESNDWTQPTLDDLPTSDDDFGELQDPTTSSSATNPSAARRANMLLSLDPGSAEDFDPTDLDFGFDKSDFEGLKQAIWGLDQDDEGEAARTTMNSGGVKPTAAAASSSNRTEPSDAQKEGERKSARGQNEADGSSRGGGSKDADLEDLDEAEVEKLEGMMRKLQAVRDMSAGMPEEQRKRLAARAVGEVMKDL